MNIHFHGTGAGEPSADRGASALTVCFPSGRRILIDAGEGVVRSLLRDGVDPGTVDAVLISHTHADHWTGLPNLIMSWVIAKRTTPVELRIPSGSLEFFNSVFRTSYLLEEHFTFSLNRKEYSTSSFDLSLPDPWRMHPFETRHLDRYRATAERDTLPFPSYGFILEGLLEQRPIKILFSQDLQSEADLQPHLKGVTHLVCEASHIDYDALLRLAQEFGPQRVILTHVSPSFDLETVITLPSAPSAVQPVVVEDGMVIDL